MSDGKHSAHGAGLSAKSEILAKIRDAEKKAEKIVAGAEAERQKILDDAHKRAAEMQNKAADRIKEESGAELKAFYGSLSKKKEKILSECETEVASMNRRAEKKLPLALDFLLGQFRESSYKQ